MIIKGDGMAKRIIIILLIFSLSFVSFADEIADSLNVQKVQENNDSTKIQPQIKNEMNTEKAIRPLASFLMGVTGFATLVVANLISIWLYKKSDPNMSSSDTLGYLFYPIIAAAGGGFLIFGISTFFEMKSGKRDFVSAMERGISYQMSYYWGCTTGLLLEFILILWALIDLIMYFRSI